MDILVKIDRYIRGEKAVTMAEYKTVFRTDIYGLELTEDDGVKLNNGETIIKEKNVGGYLLPYKNVIEIRKL